MDYKAHKNLTAHWRSPLSLSHSLYLCLFQSMDLIMKSRNELMCRDLINSFEMHRMYHKMQ